MPAEDSTRLPVYVAADTRMCIRTQLTAYLETATEPRHESEPCVVTEVVHPHPPAVHEEEACPLPLLSSPERIVHRDFAVHDRCTGARFMRWRDRANPAGPSEALGPAHVQGLEALLDVVAGIEPRLLGVSAFREVDVARVKHCRDVALAGGELLQTPDEMYFGTGDAVPTDLRSRAATARRSRVAANRSASCETCPVAPRGRVTLATGRRRNRELVRLEAIGQEAATARVPRERLSNIRSPFAYRLCLAE
jgi:hypothetical protein